jgi:hypothetical protein
VPVSADAHAAQSITHSTVSNDTVIYLLTPQYDNLKLAANKEELDISTKFKFVHNKIGVVDTGVPLFTESMIPTKLNQRETSITSTKEPFRSHLVRTI